MYTYLYTYTIYMYIYIYVCIYIVYYLLLSACLHAAFAFAFGAKPSIISRNTPAETLPQEAVKRWATNRQYHTVCAYIHICVYAYGCVHLLNCYIFQGLLFWSLRKDQNSSARPTNTENHRNEPVGSSSYKITMSMALRADLGGHL